LLRDGALFGANWGWTQSIVQAVNTQLESTITSYIDYAMTVYSAGYAAAAQTPPDDHLVEPFRTLNAYVRSMTLMVLDFVDLWPSFSALANPNGGAPIYLSREIYSDPNGSCDNSGPLRLPTNPPSQPIANISVWGWDRIDAVQLTYPFNSGPDSETTTPRLGNQSGGSNQPPYGNQFSIGTNPVTTAYVWAGDVPNAMQFGFQNDTMSNLLGGNYPGQSAYTLATATSYAYPNEILSSIWINGVSQFYQSADCVVFGFKYGASSNASPEALKALYIGSPVDVTADAFIAKITGGQAGAAATTQIAASEGWDTQREAYWSAIAQKVGPKPT
jgi:hypothetical protein